MSIPQQCNHFIVFDDDGDCRAISPERLQSLDNADNGEKSTGYLPLPQSKGWNPLAFFLEEPTPALTDCSYASRSSLQDLDLSVDGSEDSKDSHHHLKRQAYSPDVRYWKHGDCDDDVLPKTPVSAMLPSVCLKRSSPRSVSFSGIETVFGGAAASDEEVSDDADEEDSGLQYPKTPAMEWYSSRGSSRGQTTTARPPRHALPSLSSLSSSSSSTSARLQPRRSALKKPDSPSSRRHDDLEEDFFCLQVPVSPKITWYSSAKR